MPALRNPKYEIFAQNIAAGVGQDAAYVKAGYKRNKGNSSSLKQKTEVQNRIAELLEKRADNTLQKTTTEILYTREMLLAELDEARTIALENKQTSAAVSASIGKARILGLIIDRREVGDAGAFDGMTDEELLREIEKKGQEIGVGPRLVVDNEGEA
jgi:hypothetical protein